MMRQTSTYSASAPQAVQTISLRTAGLKNGTYAAAIVAGAALVSCASSASGAVSVSMARMNSTQPHLLIAARQEDTGQELADWMAEIKTRAGLTWGQLGSIFEVSRRSIQTWAAGGAISTDKRERVLELVEKIRELGNLRPFEIRDKLFGSREGAISERDMAASEAPILFADARPLKRNITVARQGKTKIKRT